MGECALIWGVVSSAPKLRFGPQGEFLMEVLGKSTIMQFKGIINSKLKLRLNIVYFYALFTLRSIPCIYIFFYILNTLRKRKIIISKRSVRT